MAASQKQYTAIFAIGGKMLGSFRGVMRQAEARMVQMRKQAAMLGTAMKAIGVGLLALVGIGAAGGLARIFKGATDAAAEEEQRLRSIQVLLLKNNAIRAHGGGDMKKALAFAGQQRDLIEAHNLELAKEGVLSRDVYDAMAKQLAIGGNPTKQIMHAVGGMGDLLVALRGVNASQEDGVELAQAMNKAIFKGQTRGLAPFGIFLDKDWQKQFTTFQARYDDLMQRMAFAKGESAARANSPEGRLAVLRKQLGELNKQIGRELLPSLGRMADVFVEAMPEIKPYVLDSVHALAGLLDAATGKIKELVHWWKQLSPEQKKKWSPTENLHSFIAALNTASWQWNHFWIGLQAGLAAIAQGWITLIRKLTDFHPPRWWYWLPGIPKSVKDQMRYGTGGAAAGAGAAGGALGAAAAVAPAGKAAASMPLTPAGLKAVQAERADIVKEMQSPAMQQLIGATLQTEGAGAENQMNVLEALTNRAVAAKRAGTYKGIQSMITGGFYGPYNRGETQALMAKGMSKGRTEQVAAMINAIGAGRNVLGGLTDQGMVNEIKGAIKEQHGEDYYGLLGKPGETQTAAYSLSRHARGGIVKRMGLSWLAEKGPEAVIPLSGGRRAMSLLNYANKALGVATGGATSVSFAPNITINGNASETEQRAMDTRLRDLMKDFLAQFKRAQYHERRLSYEGGY